MKTQHLHKGELGQMVGFMIEKYKLDKLTVQADMLAKFPQLRNKEMCANCGMSMQMYVYHLDSLNAILIYKMGKAVRAKIKDGMEFGLANRVHVQTEIEATYAVKSRTTYCAKLGLIAKITNKKGEHDRRQGWLITTRGWAFLRGETVPENVTVFRNEIVERSEDKTTIGDAFRLYNHRLKNMQLKPLRDYSKEIGEYDPMEWVDFAGPQQGALL